MKLRTRLAPTATAISIVVASAASFVEAEARRRDVTELLVARVDARLLGEGRASCERDPEAWARAPSRLFDRPRPPRGRVPGSPELEIFEELAYDAELRPRVRGAPPIDAELRRGASAGAAFAGGAYEDGDQVLVRTDGTRCAWVLSRKRRPPALTGAFLPLFADWALPLAAMLAAIVVGLGPALRRLRVLAAEVRAAPAER